jgi:hypothetical protein
MKKIKYILLIPFTFAIASCEDFLDEKPVSEIAADQFWKTPEDAKAGITGIYDGLQNTLSTNYIDWGEARSDNFKAGGTGEAQINITLNGLTATTAGASWEYLYRTISRANFAIAHLNDVTTLTTTLRNHYLAQAYTIRAFCYFYAIRVWGDVPVFLEPYEDVAQDIKRSRTPAGEIITNVILKDLDTALTLVDPTVATPVYEVNMGGILAIQTDVYMWVKDYQKVIETSDKLINLKRYSLVSTADWKKLFTDPGATKENIWSLYWSYIEDGGCGIASRIGSGSNTSQYYLDFNVMLRFENNKADIRRNLTYDTTLISTTVDKVWKYYLRGADGKIVYPATSQCDSKMVMYRYADIVLLRAEALNKLGNSTGRVIEVIDPVIRVRQKAANLTETGFGDPRKILFPISRDALNNNNKLVQNPPYSN